MVRLRPMAVAFLFNDKQEVLLLQKRSGSSFLPGYLVPVGGHMDAHEINDPRQACLREIEEETGLTEQVMDSLDLRYIIHRIKDDKEIRIQYIYTGNVRADSNLIESEEGRLLWVNRSTIADRHVTASTQEVMRHYLETGIHNNHVYVGSMHSFHGEPAMGWNVLEDWEGK